MLPLLPLPLPLLLLLLLLLLLPAAVEGSYTPPARPAHAPPRAGLPRARIAIVGAGIGGASVAAFARSEFESLGAEAPEIVVFEQSDRVGGRTLGARTLGSKVFAAPRSAVNADALLHNDDAHGTVIELGASMAIEQNRYVREMAERLGLRRRHATERPGRGSGKMAILATAEGSDPPGGRNFAFIESDYKLVTVGALLARYGTVNFYRLRSHGAELIAAFDRLYEAQDTQRAFREPRSLLAVAGMDDLSERSCEEVMAAVLGDPDALISRELLGGLMMNNYGQDWRAANALVCATAVAPLAAGGSEAAWSVVEGNDQLAARAFQEAEAEVLLGRKVMRIARRSADPKQPEDIGGYVVRHFDAGCTKQPIERCGVREQSFDFVFIAAPQRGEISIELDNNSGGSKDADAEPAQAEYPYQHVHSTLVWGRLSPSYFNQPESDADLLNSLTDILVGGNGTDDAADGGGIGRPDVPFNSVGHYGGPRPASAGGSSGGNFSLWKFFSPAPLVRRRPPFRTPSLCTPHARYMCLAQSTSVLPVV